MIKIRLHGTEKEIQESIKSLEKQFNLLSVSNPYSDNKGKSKSQYVRVYIDAEIKEG